MDKLLEAIKELLGLTELPEGEEFSGFSDDQLSEASAKAKVSFSTAKENKDLAAATLARDLFKAIDAETKRREDEAADVDEKLAELESDLEAEVKDEEEEEESDEDADKDDDKKDGEPKAEADEEPAKVEAEPVKEEEPAKVEVEQPKAIAASAKKPVPKPKANAKPAKPLVRIVASGDVDGFSAGGAMSPEDMGNAWHSKAEALYTMGQPGKRAGVATFKQEEDSSRLLLPQNPPETNSAVIDRVVAEAREKTRQTLARMANTRDEYELDTLHAAGGLCAPLEPRYDIFSIGEDNRPLADSLPGFNARRGGIRYIDADTVPYMADTDDALGHFTEAQDTEGTDYPKPCLRVDCPTWEEVLVEADTVCMIVGMWQKLTFPENFRAWWRMAQINRARQMETRLWDKMVALTTAVTAGEGLGAAPDVLTQIERAASQMRWRYRINKNTPLRLWVPTWLFDIMRTDLARRQPGDGLEVLAVTDAQLTRYFAARNVAVTTVIDAQSPGGTSGDIQAAGALNPWPSTVEVILAVEGTFLYLKMGGMNFGTEIRDFDMIRNNDVGAFYEDFESVARVGTQALSLTLNICPDGTTAGTDANFNPCTTGS